MTVSTTPCMSCHGSGEMPGTHGPEPCSDCDGVGHLPSGPTLTERRLRELELRYTSIGSEVRQDVSWLILQLRHNHHALYQILAASQELDGKEPVVKKIRHFANQALGLYPMAED